MENELDLTLRLGLPCPTVDTHLSLGTPTTYQRINVDGSRRDNNDGGEIRGRRHILRSEDESIDNDESAKNNVDVNIRYYNLTFNHFAVIGETLNFAPFPMPPAPYSSPAPAPDTLTGSDYVLIDFPARRAHRNSLAIENVLDADANLNRRRGWGGCCAERINGTRRCTNCNAINTPMWRRGPLGPKTLCNACGIKFRKEEERRSKRNG